MKEIFMYNFTIIRQYLENNHNQITQFSPLIKKKISKFSVIH